MPTNNFNRHQKLIFIFYVSCLNQWVLKIDIFHNGCFRRPKPKINSIFSVGYLEQLV
jgi:hypothetical protein